MLPMVATSIARKSRTKASRERADRDPFLNAGVRVEARA
jgi:hypothetical protein